MKICVINPGSTSTKIALFIDEKPVWVAGAHQTADDLTEFHHVNEQYEYRKNFILGLLAEADIPLDFDAVIARGGLLKPTPGGVYVCLLYTSGSRQLHNVTADYQSSFGLSAGMDFLFFSSPSQTFLQKDMQLSLIHIFSKGIQPFLFADSPGINPLL